MSKQYFFPLYTQNLSGYSRVKVLVVTGKNVGYSRGFFSQLKSSGLDVSNSAQVILIVAINVLIKCKFAKTIDFKHPFTLMTFT